MMSRKTGRPTNDAFNHHSYGRDVPTAISSLCATSGLVVRSWYNEILRLCNGSRLPILLGGLLPGILILLWEIAGISALIRGIPVSDLDIPTKTRLVSQTVLAVMVGPMVITSTALLISPPQTAMGHLVNLLPAPRWVRRVAADIPLVGVCLGVSILLVFPLITFSTNIASVHSGFRLTLLMLCVTVAAIPITWALFTAGVVLISGVARVPLVIGRVLSCCGILALGVAMLAGGYSSMDGRESELGRFGSRLVSFVVEGTLGEALLGLFAVALAGVLGVTAAITLHSKNVAAAEGRIVPILRNCGVIRGAEGVDLEIRQWARSPVVASAASVLAISISLAATLLSSENLAWVALGPAFMLLTAEVGLPAYGLTSRHHWMHRINMVGRVPWMPRKVVALCLSFAVNVSIIGTILVMKDVARIEDILLFMPKVILAFGLTILIGSIVPISQDQSASNVTAAIIATVITSAALYAVDRSGLSGNIWMSSMGLPVLTAMCLGLFAATAMRRERNGIV
jgi:hypothetical protein